MAGKTLSAVTLCLDGFEFISGEHTIVDPQNNTLVSGTKYVNCKPDTVKNYLGIDVPPIYQAKDFFGVVLAPVELELMVYIKSLPVDADSQYYELSEYKSRMILFENSGALLSGNYLTHGQTKSGFILDNPYLRASRAEGVKKMVEKSTIYGIESNPLDLINIIEGLL